MHSGTLSHLSLVRVTQFLQFATFDFSANPFFLVFAWSKPRPSSASHGSPTVWSLILHQMAQGPSLGPSLSSLWVHSCFRSWGQVLMSYPGPEAKGVHCPAHLPSVCFFLFFSSFLSSPKTISTYNITLVILSFFSFLLLDSSNSECPYVANPG